MSFWDKLAAIEIPNSLSFAVTVISTLVAVVASVYALRSSARPFKSAALSGVHYDNGFFLAVL